MISQRKRGKWNRFKTYALICFGRKRTYIVTARGRIQDAEEYEAPSSESEITINEPIYYRLRKLRPSCEIKHRPKGPFEKALEKENLYAPTEISASIPVLKICLGFSNAEFKVEQLEQQVEYYTCKPHRLPNSQRVTCSVRYLTHGPDPIFQRIPASLWLKSVEPSLPILITLHKIKHRRSNLSLRRKRSPTSSGSGSDSGDSSIEHWPLMIGPPVRFDGNAFPFALRLHQNEEVRMSRAMDFRDQLDGTDMARWVQMPLRAFNRLRHRRRRDLCLDLAVFEFLDVNQSAKPSYSVHALPTIKPLMSKFEIRSVQHSCDLPGQQSFQEKPISLCHAYSGLGVSEFASGNINNSSDDSLDFLPDCWHYHRHFNMWHPWLNIHSMLPSEIHNFGKFFETLSSGSPSSILTKEMIINIASNCSTRRLFLQKFNHYLDVIDDSEKTCDTILRVGSNMIKLENKGENSILRTIWMKKVNTSDYKESIYLRSRPPCPKKRRRKRKRETSNEFTKSENKHQPISNQSQKKENFHEICSTIPENSDIPCLTASLAYLHIGYASTDDTDKRSPSLGVRIRSPTSNQASVIASEVDFSPRLANLSSSSNTISFVENENVEGDQSNNSTTDYQWSTDNIECIPINSKVQYKFPHTPFNNSREHQANQAFLVLVIGNDYIPSNDMFVWVYTLDENNNCFLSSKPDNDTTISEIQSVSSASREYGVPVNEQIVGFLKHDERVTTRSATRLQRLFHVNKQNGFFARFTKRGDGKCKTEIAITPKWQRNVTNRSRKISLNIRRRF